MYLLLVASVLTVVDIFFWPFRSVDRPLQQAAADDEAAVFDIAATQADDGNSVTTALWYSNITSWKTLTFTGTYGLIVITGGYHFPHLPLNHNFILSSLPV